MEEIVYKFISMGFVLQSFRRELHHSKTEICNGTTNWIYFCEYENNYGDELKHKFKTPKNYDKELNSAIGKYRN